MEFSLLLILSLSQFQRAIGGEEIRIDQQKWSKSLEIANTTNCFNLENTISSELEKIVEGTDGEDVDGIEHYFWCRRNGVVLEIGSLNGLPETGSQSYLYNQILGWKRILVEANPAYRNNLKSLHDTIGINAAICKGKRILHYLISANPYVSGIIEYMQPSFLKTFHPRIYHEGVKKVSTSESSSTTTTQAIYNSSNIDWIKLMRLNTNIHLIECKSLQSIFEQIGIQHINLFILDVEGAELSVLESINWNMIKFDVIIIEKNDPLKIKQFFKSLNYNMVADMGRNLWYMRSDFEPSTRPGLKDYCYHGCMKGGQCTRDRRC